MALGVPILKHFRGNIFVEQVEPVRLLKIYNSDQQKYMLNKAKVHDY